MSSSITKPTSLFTPQIQPTKASSVNVKMISILAIIGICLIAGFAAFLYCKWLGRKNEKRIAQGKAAVEEAAGIDKIEDEFEPPSRTAKIV